MSHKIYTTEAIVCGGRTNNTSDKAYLLFTREAGMLWATARSVREERSKQRFALQDFALVRVSLVKGKSGWRIGSVEGERNYFTESKTQPERAAVASAVRLMRQFLQGEQPLPALFEDAKQALEEASKHSEASTEVIDIFSLRALFKLGYIEATPELKIYLESDEWWKLPALPQVAHEAIEKAKQVSHL